MTTVVKGSRIAAQWFTPNDPPSSLAGMGFKLGVTEHAVVGVVRHVRGDHPTAPTSIRLYVDPDEDSPWTGPTVTPYGCQCGHPHVEVNPKHAVLVERT